MFIDTVSDMARWRRVLRQVFFINNDESWGIKILIQSLAYSSELFSEVEGVNHFKLMDGQVEGEKKKNEKCYSAQKWEGYWYDRRTCR